MTLDRTLGIAGVILGLVSIALALLLDRKNVTTLKVKRVNIAMSAVGDIRGESGPIRVGAIELELENPSRQAVNECVALAVFSTHQPLPFKLVLNHSRTAPEQTTFTVQPQAHVSLRAAWQPGPGELTYEEFVRKCLPATIDVKWGKKHISYRITESFAHKQFQRFQRQRYGMNI